MVKEPQGIGKSRSIANVVLKLKFSGNDHVVKFPDCEWWTDTSYFFDSFIWQKPSTNSTVVLDHLSAMSTRPCQSLVSDGSFF